MKTAILLILTGITIGCSSSKQDSKYDFSNVQSTSLDAQIYNTSPRNILTDSVVIIQPQSAQPKQ